MFEYYRSKLGIKIDSFYFLLLKSKKNCKIQSGQVTATNKIYLHIKKMNLYGVAPWMNVALNNCIVNYWLMQTKFNFCFIRCYQYTLLYLSSIDTQYC